MAPKLAKCQPWEPYKWSYIRKATQKLHLRPIDMWIFKSIILGKKLKSCVLLHHRRLHRWCSFFCKLLSSLHHSGVFGVLFHRMTLLLSFHGSANLSKLFPVLMCSKVFHGSFDILRDLTAMNSLGKRRY